MTQSIIRVLIVDDHTIVRKGVQVLLAEIENIEVIGEAANGWEAVEKAETLQPDVILMDLVMPEMDGIEAISQITSNQPETHILALTSYSTDDKIFPDANELEAVLKTENADAQALEMAIEAEEKFADYFQKACEMALSEDGKEAFSWLANEEVRHAKILKERKAKLSGD